MYTKKYRLSQQLRTIPPIHLSQFLNIGLIGYVAGAHTLNCAAISFITGNALWCLGTTVCISEHRETLKKANPGVEISMKETLTSCCSPRLL